jgi:hypothetical protein
MVRLSHLPFIAALIALTACADSGVKLPQLSQADLDKQAALTACTSAANAVNRPVVHGDVQLYSRPGQPYFPGPDWQTSRTRSIDSCMASKGYSEFKSGTP